MGVDIVVGGDGGGVELDDGGEHITGHVSQSLMQSKLAPPAAVFPPPGVTTAS